jgi:hypothetical protein
MGSLIAAFDEGAKLTRVVCRGAVVDVSELSADDASDSMAAGDFAPKGRLDGNAAEFIVQLLLRNLNSIQGIADFLLRSSWVDPVEILCTREKS